MEELEKKEFCLINTAEHAPEISNEFVTKFMEDKKNEFQNQIDIQKCE